MPQHCSRKETTVHEGDSLKGSATAKPTRLDIIAELFLVTHALLHEAMTQPDVFCILNFLPEELLLAFP